MTNNNVGDKIRLARQAERMTQKELAEKIGCSSVTVSRWELGKCNPSYQEIEKINEVLSVDIQSKNTMLSEEDLVHELSRISMGIEDLRLDALKREKKRIIWVILIMIIVFLVVLYGLYSWVNWKNPNDTDDEPIRIYYYYDKEIN